MRVSVNEDLFAFRNLVVYLEGREEGGVQAASEEEGWVDVYDLVNNLLTSKPTKNVKRLYGKVEVRLKEGTPSHILELMKQTPKYEALFLPKPPLAQDEKPPVEPEQVESPSADEAAVMDLDKELRGKL